MKATLTAKPKLLPTPDQFRAARRHPGSRIGLRFHYVSACAFAHGKISSGKQLQKALYADLRRQFGLPAQMACNVPRQVGSTYQTLWTKARKNAEARRLTLYQTTRSGAGPGTRLTSPPRSPPTWGAITRCGRARR